MRTRAWQPARARRFRKEAGYESHERYLDDPASTAPAQLRTELCIPLV